MEKKRTGDMTRGNPTKLLILFALPMMVGSIFQSLYNTVDSIVVGRFVSAEALGAIGATNSTTFMMLSLAMGITSAISIVISQLYGAKEDAKLKKCTVSAMYLTLALGVIFGVLSFVIARPLMLLLGAPPEVIDMAVTYVRITCGLCIANFFYNAAASTLRAMGDSRTPLYFLILCSLLNIALNLLFVIKFHMGVAGVAYATVISQAVSAVGCIIRIFQKYPDLRFGVSDLAPDFELIKRITGMGLSMGVQSCVTSLGMMVVTRVINSFGADVVVAQTVGARVQNLAIMMFSQFSFSFSVYAGQNFGARDFERIRQGFRSCFLLVGGLSILAATLVFIFGDQIILLFVNADETSVIAIARKLIRIAAAFYPFLGWIWLYLSTLKGVGAIPPVIISGFVELAAKILLSIGLSRIWGATGIWFAEPIGWVLGIIPVAAYYYSGRWKKLSDKKKKQPA